ncbi:MAG: hypothetical protein HKN29_09580 [Rhodothermales bacterium]|nr:hypothetical protein [Rhodothermales bacterium]
MRRFSILAVLAFCLSVPSAQAQSTSQTVTIVVETRNALSSGEAFVQLRESSEFGRLDGGSTLDFASSAPAKLTAELHQGEEQDLPEVWAHAISGDPDADVFQAGAYAPVDISAGPLEITAGLAPTFGSSLKLVYDLAGMTGASRSHAAGVSAQDTSVSRATGSPVVILTLTN